jgi:hypothetical protein
VDFYFAASGLIPILALAVLIETNVHPMSVRVPPKWLKGLVERANVEAYERGGYWHVPALGLFVGWAEFICLRTLETGHVAWGGATVVWAALTVLGSLALVFAWIASLPEARD